MFGSDQGMRPERQRMPQEGKRIIGEPAEMLPRPERKAGRGQQRPEGGKRTMR